MAEDTIPYRAGARKSGQKTERRAWLRKPGGQDVCCQPLAAPTKTESETGWLGTVLNVSAGGIAVLLNRRFEPGTTLIVELKGRSRGLPVRVVHATAEGKGRWIIGCAFASPLTPEELQAFLQCYDK